MVDSCVGQLPQPEMVEHGSAWEVGAVGCIDKDALTLARNMQSSIYQSRGVEKGEDA